MSTVGSAALAEDRNEPMEWTASDASVTGAVLQKLQPGDDRGNSTFSSDEELRIVSFHGLCYTQQHGSVPRSGVSFYGS